MCKPLEHGQPVKNSDLYTKPGLDTGVKNSQIWHNAEKTNMIISIYK